MEKKLLQVAKQQDDLLRKLQEGLDARKILNLTNDTWKFERAKQIGHLNMLDAVGIDRTEFNWIF